MEWWLVFIIGSGVGSLIGSPIADFLYPNDRKKNFVVFSLVGLLSFAILWAVGAFS